MVTKGNDANTIASARHDAQAMVRWHNALEIRFNELTREYSGKQDIDPRDLREYDAVRTLLRVDFYTMSAPDDPLAIPFKDALEVPIHIPASLPKGVIPLHSLQDDVTHGTTLLKTLLRNGTLENPIYHEAFLDEWREQTRRMMETTLRYDSAKAANTSQKSIPRTITIPPYVATAGVAFGLVAATGLLAVTTVRPAIDVAPDNSTSVPYTLTQPDPTQTPRPTILADLTPSGPRTFNLGALTMDDIRSGAPLSGKNLVMFNDIITAYAQTDEKDTATLKALDAKLQDANKLPAEDKTALLGAVLVHAAATELESATQNTSNSAVKLYATVKANCLSAKKGMIYFSVPNSGTALTFDTILGTGYTKFGEDGFAINNRNFSAEEFKGWYEKAAARVGKESGKSHVARVEERRAAQNGHNQGHGS